MPVVRQTDQHVETIEYFDKKQPNLECWLTEPGRLTQFGAFIHVLQPGTRSSIKHWHSDEDELVYLLEGEITFQNSHRKSLSGSMSTTSATPAVSRFSVSDGGWWVPKYRSPCSR